MLIPLIFILPRLTDSLHPGSGGNPGFNVYDLNEQLRIVFYPAVIGFICFLSNFPRKYFYGILLSGLFIGLSTFFLKAYRIKRLLTFLDPWKNPKTSGFQIIQSYLAFANGSFLGQGLGNSNEKLF